MYAIVRAGGHQEKVAVGDVVEIDRVAGEPGVDPDPAGGAARRRRDRHHRPETLAGVTVTAEIVGEHQGPQDHILKYKNKTGYRKRQGHRQK